MILSVFDCDGKRKRFCTQEKADENVYCAFERFLHVYYVETDLQNSNKFFSFC